MIYIRIKENKIKIFFFLNRYKLKKKKREKKKTKQNKTKQKDKSHGCGEREGRRKRKRKKNAREKINEVQERVNIVRQDLKKNETKNGLISRHVREKSASILILSHPAARQSVGPSVRPFIF